VAFVFLEFAFCYLNCGSSNLEGRLLLSVVTPIVHSTPETLSFREPFPSFSISVRGWDVYLNFRFLCAVTSSKYFSTRLNFKSFYLLLPSRKPFHC